MSEEPTENDTETSDVPDGNEDLDVAVSENGLVIRATINRPEKRNALNGNVIDGLSAVLSAADTGPPRVVVIRGAEETFCSGGDLMSMASTIGQGLLSHTCSLSMNHHRRRSPVRSIGGSAPSCADGGSRKRPNCRTNRPMLSRGVSWRSVAAIAFCTNIA